MTSDVKGWEQLFYVCLIFSLFSLGRAGARKTRRLLTLLSVGWVPPSLPPSGACLTRGTRGPCGLCTLPRVTPHRGCAASARGWKPRTLVWQHPVILRRAAARPPAGPWPTCRPCMPGPWPQRLEGHVCLWPSPGDPVCRAGLALAHCWPGARRGALPGAVAGADCLALATGTPRRLRRAPDAPGYCPSWAGCLADAAAHWQSLTASPPKNACAVGGYGRASGLRVRPPGSPRRCTGRPVRPGAPRPPAGRARCAPGRGVRGRDAASVRAVR
jgi:hypothetical protein